MRSGRVVIVGAGVVGASVAYHLAARGGCEVVVLDAAVGPGKGSTGAATGGFRAQFSTRPNVGLSLLARERLRSFEEETGVDSGYVPAGYLWLAGTEAEALELRRALEVQGAAGLEEATEISLDDAARLNPHVRLDGVVAATFCPTDGFMRPLEILRGYRDAAERRGATFRWGTAVTAMETDGEGRIVAVKAGVERLGADAFVNAAGPWAADVGRMAGVDLPVVPVRRQVAATEPFEGLPETMPMTIFTGDGFHLRVRDGRVLLLWPTPGVPDRPRDTSVDPRWVEDVARIARERVPVLRRARIDRDGCWAGLYEMSPDRHVIVGYDPACPNLLLVNGSSGHGVMHAPALGVLASEILCEGRATSLDVTPLRPTRFREGEMNVSSELL